MCGQRLKCVAYDMKYWSTSLAGGWIGKSVQPKFEKPDLALHQRLTKGAIPAGKGKSVRADYHSMSAVTRFNPTPCLFTYHMPQCVHCRYGKSRSPLSIQSCMPIVPNIIIPLVRCNTKSLFQKILGRHQTHHACAHNADMVAG
jgi:hypothetical protein